MCEEWAYGPHMEVKRLSARESHGVFKVRQSLRSQMLPWVCSTMVTLSCKADTIYNHPRESQQAIPSPPQCWPVGQ